MRYFLCSHYERLFLSFVSVREKAHCNIMGCCLLCLLEHLISEIYPNAISSHEET